MIISRQGARRGIGWQGARSDVCLIVDEPVEQAAKAVNAREESLSTSDLPSSRNNPQGGDRSTEGETSGKTKVNGLCSIETSGYRKAVLIADW